MHFKLPDGLVHEATNEKKDINIKRRSLRVLRALPALSAMSGDVGRPGRRLGTCSGIRDCESSEGLGVYG